MFGKSSEEHEHIVFRFGALPPTAGFEPALDQMRRRKRLWNSFVEIERWFRKEESVILNIPAEDSVAEAKAELVALRHELRSLKGKTAYAILREAARKIHRRLESMTAMDAQSSHQMESSLLHQLHYPQTRLDYVHVDKPKNGVEIRKSIIRQIKELLSIVGRLTVASKEARKEKRAAAKQELDALEKERCSKVKAAMTASGCWWCNSDDVRANYEVQRKEVRGKVDRNGMPCELQFHRFDGSGKLAIRYQQGLTISKAFGSDSRLRITRFDFDKVWRSADRKERRKCCTTVKLRVGSQDPNKSPVFVDMPVYLDGRPERHLQMDGQIRSAFVTRTKVGRFWRWNFGMVVRKPGNSLPEVINNGSVRAGAEIRRIAIDIGWRNVDGGTRVGYWADTDNHGAIVLPARIINPMLKCDDLASIRAKRFDAICADLSLFLAAHGNIPAWLKESTVQLAAWRKKSHLAMLLKSWEKQRFSGDEAIVTAIQEWNKKDVHLWDWEANQEEQAQACRRELYRVFAAQKVQQYSEVIMANFDLRSVLVKPHVESDDVLMEGRCRTLAAPSILRSVIENFCKREHIKVTKVEAPNRTRRCHECGTINSFDQRSQLRHVCVVCASDWDQDANSCWNLLNFEDWTGSGAIEH